VVAADGTVERIVTRAQMRAGGLRHRCAYIAVLDAADRLVVHQRAPWKDVWPLAWDVAFGGVVGVGEDWHTAAVRELAQEAGVQAALVEVTRMAYDAGAVHVVGVLYLARHDGPFTFPDGEVVAVDRIPIDDVREWVAERDVCPDSVAFLESGGLIPTAATGLCSREETPQR
jgi:isopentenyldiphosphate isomerase